MTLDGRARTLIVVAMLLTVSVAVAELLGTKTSLTCSRLTGSCEHGDRTLFRSWSETFPLRDLKGAAARPYGRKGARHLVLLTTQGDRPFTGYGTGVLVGRMDRNAETVRRFLRTPRETDLLIEQDDRFIGIILGTLITAVGLGVRVGGWLR